MIFATTPPPPPPPLLGEGIDALVYGDSGDGSRAQRAVGLAMWRSHQAAPFDAAFTTGDNQYLPTTANTFQRIFEVPYAELIGAGLRFYQTIGNHDLEANRLADQLAYSRRVDALARGVGGWVLPAESHVVRQKGVKWISVNLARANGRLNFGEAQRAFLERELCEDTPDWKVLLTHYPFWSTGPRGDNREMNAEVLPLLRRCPADFHFAGHEHHAEAFLPWNWMPSFIVGNAREVRKGRARSDRESLAFVNALGFARVTFRGDVARVTFETVDNRIAWQSTYQKRIRLWGDAWTQKGARFFSRVKLEGKTDVANLEVELGVSSSPFDPLLAPDVWAFRPQKWNEFDPPTGHDVFVAELTPEDAGKYVVSRFRVKGTARWIYADQAGGGKHGNYDGLQTWNLPRLGVVDAPTATEGETTRVQDPKGGQAP